MRLVKPILITCFLIFCVVALVTATAKVKAFRKDLPIELFRGEALMVDPDLLRVVGGEFKGLLADYLLIKAAIIDGGEPEKMTEQDWEAVYELYKQSLALDPFFYQTAYYVQGNIIWIDSLRDKAIELLKQSAGQRTWDWNPLWFLGFNYAHFYSDLEQAAAYFFEAAKKQDAPPILGILAARLSQGGGDTLTSIVMLKAMLEQTEDENIREVLKARIHAHEGVLQIEQAVDAFQKTYGRLPDSLDELIETGIISELPSHPYGEKYLFDPATGVVDYGVSRK